MSASSRTIRENKGWSQQRLAEEARVSIRTVQLVEGGKNPRIETARRLARALGVTLNDLFPEEIPA